ncbi:MAG: ABC transporter [Dehalococcoidia bacterium]|nr:MAG: ABC transporter [Dehalococcoidia bacterium]
MTRLVLQEVHHRYGAQEVLRGVSLNVGASEVVCLLGPSGAGKTTVLRVAAGLEPVQAGVVAIDGTVVARPGRQLPPEQRRIGMVFQDYALFPHLTVAGNVEFGLRGPAKLRRQRVQALLERVGLAALTDRYPHTLSGGQQQRVALARALAREPAVVLLDEPFASLDATLREQVRDETLALLREAGVAVLLVTHDANEAMAAGDRIALLQAGRIEQDASPETLYRHPVSRAAATALGRVNVVPGIITAGHVHSRLGSWPVARSAGAVELLVRPEQLIVQPEAGGGVGSRPGALCWRPPAGAGARARGWSLPVGVDADPARAWSAGRAGLSARGGGHPPGRTCRAGRGSRSPSCWRRAGLSQ